MRGKIVLLAFLAAGLPAVAATKRTTGKRATGTGGNVESVREECTTQYIAALDRECFDETAVNRGGVYVKCNTRSASDLYDAMDMQSVAMLDQKAVAGFVKKCQAYKSYALARWLGDKEVVEKAAVKSSPDCIYAMEDLTAAKQCYSAALAHDGNFFEFDKAMAGACGTKPAVARKFAKAGDLGLSKLPQIIENYATMQFTNKDANWRQAVEATLVNYMYAAQHACGDGDYDMIILNEFETDERENLLTLMNRSYAEAYASGVGSRGGAFSAIAAMGSQGSVYSGGALSAPSIVYPSSTQVVFPKKAEAKKSEPVVTSGVSTIGNIYLVQASYGVTTVRARLASLVVSGDIGSRESRDDLDMAILSSLGGRAGAEDGEIYNLLARIGAGDVFVIQSGGTCQVLQMANNRLDILSSADVSSIKVLSGYTGGCRAVAE
ncbi:MAG: hypothetical protein LBT92_04150 [Rickettsiales bacterium]|jgi:hypothetical protein|nr:hypothetical protein [Rickettsiales bacterium]